MKRNLACYTQKALFALLVLLVLCSARAESVSVQTAVRSVGMANPFAEFEVFSFTANFVTKSATATTDVVYVPDNGDPLTATLVPASQQFTIQFAGQLYTYVQQVALNNIQVDNAYMQECIKLTNTATNAEVDVTVAVTVWTASLTEITVTPVSPLESDANYLLTVLDDKLQYGVRNVNPLGNSDFVFDVYGSNNYVVEDTTVPMLDETRDDGLWQDGYYVGTDETILSDDQLKLDFTEAVQAGSGTVKIYTWNGTLVTTIDASTLTIDPSDPSIVIVSGVSGLIVDETYYVIVDAGAITDLSGNPFEGVDEEDDWSFTVRSDQKPDVVSYSPTGPNVAIDTDLVIEFDLAVELGAGNVNLYLADGTLVQSLNVVTDAVYFSPVGNKIYIDIDPLLAETAYMVNVDAGAFVSAAGESSEAISSADWQFETESNDAPLLVDLTPDDNSVDVPLTQQFIMEFDMDVQAGSGMLELHLADGANTLVISIAASDSRVTINGSKVTIDFSDILVQGESYYIIVYPDFVKNTSATPESYAGLLKVFNWNFETATETTAPQYLILSPDETTISDNHPTFSMTFDEAIQLSSTGGNLYVYNKDNGSLALTIPLTADMIANNILTASYTYDGTNGLALNTNYYVIVDAGAIEDVNGNDFTGISDPTEWTFKTGQDYALGIGDDLAEAGESYVYPNPFSDVVYLSGSDNINRLVFTNALGQRVKEISNPSETVSTSDLRNGIYIISLMLDDVIVTTQRIIKR